MANFFIMDYSLPNFMGPIILLYIPLMLIIISVAITLYLIINFYRSRSINILKLLILQLLSAFSLTTYFILHPIEYIDNGSPDHLNTGFSILFPWVLLGLINIFVILFYSLYKKINYKHFIK